MARLARHAGKDAEEVRALVQALECDAQNGRVCSDVALRAMEVGDLELATRALRAITLVKTAPPPAAGVISKALAYQHMGEIARQQGDPRRALALVHRALTEDPELVGARALAAAIEQKG
jgi:Tfp pilus assembly protein PilF